MILSQLMWIVIAFLFPMFGNENWGVSTTFDYLVSTGKVFLFVDNHLTRKLDAEVTTGNVLYATCGCLTILACGLLNALTASALGMASFTIWVATSKFSEEVQNQLLLHQKSEVGDKIRKGESTIDQLHHNFNKLVKLVNSINSTWSLLIFWVLVDATAWHSASLDLVIKYEDHLLKIYTIYNLVYIATSLILSAESSRKVNI